MPHVRTFPGALEGKRDPPELVRRDRVSWHNANIATREAAGIAGTAPGFRRVAELRGNTHRKRAAPMAIKLQNRTAC
jgi:hypothetical protein